MSSSSPIVAGKILAVSGWFPRIARIRAEHHDLIDDVPSFVDAAKRELDADLFTFIQPVSDPKPKHDYHLEFDELAVLEFASYESWWKNQLNDKTRNMIRKAGKKGVEIRIVQCDDELIRGIKEIYDECPVRQGKPFKHYNKDFQTLKDAHLTFLERSEFIGAYLEGKLIGFIKMIYHGQSVSIMQIISMIAHRDKAPTNALLAKAVEICAAKGIRHLQYGIWSRRSMGEFKRHHCFELVKVPRYYVPLTWKGSLALKLRVHRNLLALVPEDWLDWLAGIRSRWYSRKATAAVG